MDKLIGVIVLLIGLSISGVAAYFSIIGLAAIFSASVIPIIIMGSFLELGKVAAAFWLHKNWSIAPKLLKIYLIIAVFFLMVITSLGIFGFLSKSHIEQQSVSNTISINLSTTQTEIDFLKSDLVRLERELTVLDSVVNGYLRNDRITQAREIQASQEVKRKEITNQIQTIVTNIRELELKKTEHQTSVNAADIKLGPIEYLMELMNLNNSDQAVRWFIFLIMIVFDPVAIALILAAQWSLSGAYVRIKEEENIKNILAEESALAKIAARKTQIRIETEKESKALERQNQLLAQRKRFEGGSSLKDIS
jgi:hypothetical protein